MSSGSFYDNGTWSYSASPGITVTWIPAVSPDPYPTLNIVIDLNSTYLTGSGGYISFSAPPPPAGTYVFGDSYPGLREHLNVTIKNNSGYQMIGFDLKLVNTVPIYPLDTNNPHPDNYAHFHNVDQQTTFGSNERLSVFTPDGSVAAFGGVGNNPAPSEIMAAGAVANGVSVVGSGMTLHEEEIPGRSSNSFSLNVSANFYSSVHANDLLHSGHVTGPYNFIDLLNLEASYSDLIAAFGTNAQAMRNWYNGQEFIEQRPDTFDGLDYIASYSDLIDAFKSAGSENAVLDQGAWHFIVAGAAEGRTTTFNGLDYIASYGDLINAYGSNGDIGAYHYIEWGSSEGRTITFDGLDYIASYPDLIKAFGANEQAGAWHFIVGGYKEGRTTTFDGLEYIAGYTDLMKAFGANNDAGAAHYIQYGANQGRSAHPFDVGAYEALHPDLITTFGSNKDAFLTAYINNYYKTGTFLT